MTERQHVVVQPDTRRMVEGLRDTGYTFNAAVADIIDNSIAAGASRVSIYVDWASEGDVPLVTIADDGHGMDLDGLRSAMRYGATERDSRSSLGRFGLGLKTASTGFCRRLTVLSRDGGAADVGAAVWDLDDLAQAGEWNLDLGPADFDEVALWEDAIDELLAMDQAAVASGTVVVWQKVDKLLKTKSGGQAKNQQLAMRKTADQLVEHLEMVFQRFLDPSDVRVPHVRMAVNGKALEPWDPFQEHRGIEPELSKTMKFRPTYSADAALVDHEVTLRAFILPRKDEFETDQARADAKIGLDRQGVYLYRENRMIEGPDWLGLWATETHINNLRVELSFPGHLDELFGVGIKKSGVHIDPQLIDLFRTFLLPVRKEADRRSRKGRGTGAGERGSASRPTERTISRLKGSLTTATVEAGADGSVNLRNNAGELVVKDSSGKGSGIVAIAVDEAEMGLSVVRDDSLDDGALWEARLTQSAIQVAINEGHPWYRKAYLPNVADTNLVQAIEYLFYALAQAEMNNTDVEAQETFEEFRIEVSRNLKKLVRDLPDPDDD